MASLLWGKVYFKDTYAGRLHEEPGGRCIFTYDTSYLESVQPAISHTLPLQAAPYVSERGLHPFFDNLAAEGWFRNAQAKALAIDPNHRFALLLGFGDDLVGAVSIIDPEPQERRNLDHSDEAIVAALLSRASISGVQRKLLVVKDGKQYRPVRAGDNKLSTHIAKLTSGSITNIIEVEYLTTLAVKKLLPADEVVETEIVTIEAIHEQALVIPRFDRSASGKRLHHFEEFNQLLGKYSGDKYNSSYEAMGTFITNTPGCIPAEADRLFRRIIACLIVGNTDAHLKNFAMFHTRDGLRLTPCYDLVAAALYPEYQSIALRVSGIENLAVGSLLPKHVLKMAEGFGLPSNALMAATEDIGKRLPLALAAIEKSDVGSKILRDQLMKLMEKRWNGSFKLTGQLLSVRQSKGEKSKS